MKNMKVKRVLVDPSCLFVSYCREAGEKEKEGPRDTMGRGKREDVPIVSRALSMDTQRQPLRWKRSLLCIPLRPLVVDFCSGIFLWPAWIRSSSGMSFNSNLKNQPSLFLILFFILFSPISMLCYYPRSFKHTTSAQQFKSFLHAHYWPVCTRPPPLRKNRGYFIFEGRWRPYTVSSL